MLIYIALLRTQLLWYRSLTRVVIKEEMEVWEKTGGPRGKTHHEDVHEVQREEIINLTSEDEKHSMVLSFVSTESSSSRKGRRHSSSCGTGKYFRFSFTKLDVRT